MQHSRSGLPVAVLRQKSPGLWVSLGYIHWVGSQQLTDSCSSYIARCTAHLSPTLTVVVHSQQCRFMNLRDPADGMVAELQVPIQAMIGSKIVCRESIRATRKDVLAKVRSTRFNACTCVSSTCLTAVRIERVATAASTGQGCCECTAITGRGSQLLPEYTSGSPWVSCPQRSYRMRLFCAYALCALCSSNPPMPLYMPSR